MKIAVVLAAVAALLAGCGGDHAKKLPTVRAAPTPSPKVQAAPAPSREVAVIRGWVNALRAGEVDAASRFFHTPALAENGTGEIPLQTRRAVRFFNESLPCGARLLDAKRVAGGYTIGVFRLTDRPGGDCGQGVGGRAAVAFRFSGGRIAEWRRVAVPEFKTAPAPRV